MAVDNEVLEVERIVVRVQEDQDSGDESWILLWEVDRLVSSLLMNGLVFTTGSFWVIVLTTKPPVQSFSKYSDLKQTMISWTFHSYP